MGNLLDSLTLFSKILEPILFTEKKNKDGIVEKPTKSMFLIYQIKITIASLTIHNGSTYL